MVPLNKAISANTGKQGEKGQVLGQPGQQHALSTSPVSSGAQHLLGEFCPV